MTYTVSRIISDETLSCIIQIESAGRPAAKASTSSATGLGQFIKSTWLSVIRAHRPDLCAGKTEAEILALRTEPTIAIEMLARFTEGNARALGPGYTDGDLYLAHFAGSGTAKKLKSAPRIAGAETVFNAAAINANASILRGKTCGQVRDWAASKMVKAGGKGWVAKWYRGPAVKPQSTITPAKPDPINNTTRAAVGGVAATAISGGVALQQGVSIMEVIAWIGGLLVLGVLAYGTYYWWAHRSPETLAGSIEDTDAAEKLIEARGLPVTLAAPAKRKAVKKPVKKAKKKAARR